MGEKGRRARRVLTVLVAAVAVVAASIAPAPAADAPPSSAEQAAAARRVMVVGDSISHASVGDYGWRYFAWKNLVRSRASVDFVGPNRAPYVMPGDPWRAAYSDPDFDQDHAATWGDSLTSPRHYRTALMRGYRPDVVVLALGTNDLGPFVGQTPANLVPLARTWVREARREVPGVDVVLVDVPPTSASALVYNGLLEALAAELDSSGERVVVAQAADGFVPGRDDDSTVDTYDPWHPNARGQVKIAAAVSDALAAIGVGAPYPRPLSFPAEGPRTRPSLTAKAADSWALLTWSVPPGATSADVWARREGRGWRRVARAHPSSSFGVEGLAPCVEHRFRVRARKGWTRAGTDVASPVARTTVGPSVAHVAPPRTRLRATSRAVRVRWSKVAGSCTYRVRTVHRTASGRKVVRVRTVTARTVRLTGFPAGATVTVRVRALGARDQGGWSPRTTVRVPRR